MDELTIDGKTYVSSKRAAKLTGYAKDYVGQLCREGRLESRLVGRSWYVLLDALNSHRFKAGEMPKVEVPVEQQTEKVWEKPRYSPVEPSTLPDLSQMRSVNRMYAPSERDVRVQNEEHVALVSQMQDAWQEWFTSKATHEVENEAVAQTQVIEEESSTNNLESTTFYGEDTVIDAPVEGIESEPTSKAVAAEEVPVVRIIETKVTHREDIQGATTKPQRQSRPQSAGGSVFLIHVTRAALITVSLIFAGIAVVGSGLIDTIGSKSIANIPVLNIIAGVTATE